MSYDLKKLTEHFFSDPMWPEVEEMLMEYLEPFRDVENINTQASNDEIATEVRGRQLMVKQLEKFLGDTGVLRSRLNKPLQSFK